MRAQRFGAVSDWLVILICERSTTAHAASPMEPEAKQEVQSPSQGGNGHGDLQMARKTSKSASKDVKRAMRKRKKGTLKSGRSGQNGEEQEAGYRDWPLRSAQEGKEGWTQAIKKEEQVTFWLIAR
jgi:hypothetical protein